MVPEIADRHAHAGLIEQRERRVDGGLGVQRVDDRLDQQQIDAAEQQRARRVQVGRHQLIEVDAAEARIVDIGR